MRNYSTIDEAAAAGDGAVWYCTGCFPMTPKYFTGRAPKNGVCDDCWYRITGIERRTAVMRDPFFVVEEWP